MKLVFLVATLAVACTSVESNPVPMTTTDAVVGTRQVRIDALRPGGVADLDVDPHVPFSTLVGVLRTLTRQGVEHFRFVLRGTPSSAPRELAVREPPLDSNDLLAIVVSDGIALKGRGGNVAPGCTDVGAGLAIEGHDFEALARCSSTLRAFVDTMSVTADRDVEFQTIVRAMDAVVHDYPKITLLL